MVPERNTPLILVVDDDFPNRYLLMKRLELIGIDSVQAENGFQALEMFETFLPNLVFTDINMPILDGIKATETLKSKHPSVPVFAITAEPRKSSIQLFDEYFEKPFDWLKVEEKLSSYGIFDLIQGDEEIDGSTDKEAL